FPWRPADRSDRHRPLDLGVGPRLCAAIVPASAQKEARRLAERLFEIGDETPLAAAGATGRDDVRRAPARVRERLPVAPHTGPVVEDEEPRRALLTAELVLALELHHEREGVAQRLIDLEPIGLLRFGGCGEPSGPSLGLVLDRDAPCVAARVGGVVP